VSTRTGFRSGTSPVSIPPAGLVDGPDEGVKLLITRGIGIIPRLGEDLGAGPQPTSLGTDPGQIAGAAILSVSTPATFVERSLRHLRSLLSTR
jgi:hypothetical protein